VRDAQRQPERDEPDYRDPHTREYVGWLRRHHGDGLDVDVGDVRGNHDD
jgi:hypothetical protein